MYFCVTPIACESSRSFYINNDMNKNYNKHLFYIIIVLLIIVMIMILLTKHNNKVDYDICGIDSAYINDSIPIEEYYDVAIDTIIKTDNKGNVYTITR